MIRFRPLLVVLVGVAGLTAAVAQDAPQVARQELMGQIGDNAKILGDMAKGARPYEEETAVQALDAIIDDIAEFTTLFPEGSETGHETRARSSIWQDKSAFEEDAMNLQEAAVTAREAAPGGHEAFAPAFQAVGRTCGACHNDFRAKQS